MDEWHHHIAQRSQDQHLAAALAQHQPRTPRPQFDGIHCCDCGHLIPPPRVALGMDNCVACQTRKEKAHAHQTRKP